MSRAYSSTTLNCGPRCASAQHFSQLGIFPLPRLGGLAGRDGDGAEDAATNRRQVTDALPRQASWCGPLSLNREAPILLALERWRFLVTPHPRHRQPQV